MNNITSEIESLVFLAFNVSRVTTKGKRNIERAAAAAEKTLPSIKAMERLLRESLPVLGHAIETGATQTHKDNAAKILSEVVQLLPVS